MNSQDQACTNMPNITSDRARQPNRLIVTGKPTIARIRAAFVLGMRTLEIWQSLIAGLFLLAGLMNSCPAEAATNTPEWRIARAYHKFSDVYQVAASWHLKAPKRLYMSRTELSVGAITSSGKSRAQLSFGPVWRLNKSEQLAFVEFGFAPTILGGSKLGPNDLGGNFHFTSSLSVGRQFGRSGASRIALRVQHLSNGGLNSTNPGLDTIGISVLGSLR